MASPGVPSQRMLRIVGCLLVVALCLLFLANLGLSLTMAP